MNRALSAGRDLVARVGEQARRVELMDRSYTVAASAFVALMPLVLLITGFFTSGESPVAGALITRLRLEGPAEGAVRLLLSGGTPGLYPLGLLVVLYSAFSLSRRIGRAYSAIWQVPMLAWRDQWRGLVWVLMQVAVMSTVGLLRQVAVEYGPVLSALAFAGTFGVWFSAELGAQWLLTLGRVPWRRLRVAALLVAVGRLGLTSWFVFYMSNALSRQAEQYGPIGVVFSLFTGIFAATVVTLFATLLAAVLTDPGESEVPG